MSVPVIPVDLNSWGSIPPSHSGAYLSWSAAAGVRLVFVVSIDGVLRCMHDIDQFNVEIRNALKSDGQDPVQYTKTCGIEKWSGRVNYPR